MYVLYTFEHTSMTRTKNITPAEYSAFQEAYDFFNTALFDGLLPDVLVTLQRQARSRGYFSPQRFRSRVEEALVHELALNPDCFPGRTDEEICSTLAHEMVHVWQQTYGRAPRKAYHDRQWAAKMKEIGLHPSATGEPGGRETGQSMTHFILQGGRYARAFRELQATGFQLHWQSAMAEAGSRVKRTSKTKLTCPECSQNVWAKPGAQVICGVCYSDEGEICVMSAREGEEEGEAPQAISPAICPGARLS